MHISDGRRFIPAGTIEYFAGEDIARWLAPQRHSWERLDVELRHRLNELGVTKAVRTPDRRVPRKPPGEAGSSGGRAAAAFETGVRALAQYLEREGEGSGLPGRGHAEELLDGTAHRTGIWIVNQKQRRAGLDPGQLAALAGLGVHWAR
ncbi:hypothetical protein ACIQWR_38595 [Streptomyces sp. NPDC098789]|uniref:hypothetical protein n=1 Tax=Streptomyces sp. NPDC098789 TaxID=3366098 RepID=UPI00383029B1